MRVAETVELPAVVASSLLEGQARAVAAAEMAALAASAVAEAG